MCVIETFDLTPPWQNNETIQNTWAGVATWSSWGAGKLLEVAKVASEKIVNVVDDLAAVAGEVFRIMWMPNPNP